MANESRELGRSLNDLLIDSVSIPFNFSTLWKEINTNCINILQWESVFSGKDSAQKMCNTVMSTYTLVYHLISHPCVGTPVVKTGGKEVCEGQQLTAVHSLLGGIFELHLLQSVVPGFSESQRSSTVQTYVRFWRSFLVAVVNIKTIFSSLTDKWTLLGLEDNPLERTEDVALKKWSEVVLSPTVVSQLREELRKLLIAERNGEATSDLPYAMELKDELAMLPDLSYYRSIVETDYIKDMCDYCRSTLGNINSDDLYIYAKASLKLINEETRRAERYLTCRDRAVDHLIEMLVDERIPFFEASDLPNWMNSLYENPSHEGLRTVFHLLWCSKGRGAPLMECMFKNSVARCTSLALQNAVESPADGSDACTAVIYCGIELIRKYRNIVSSVFDGDGCMMEAMNEGLQKSFANARSLNFKKIADRLAAFSNTALRNGAKSDLQLGDIISVFYFLPDVENSGKDAFLTSYQKGLAKRLLFYQYNEAWERHALEQLAQVKQSPILFCCRSMLKSVTSRSIDVHSATEKNVKVQAQLLSKGVWPGIPCSSSGVGAAPPPIAKIVEAGQRLCVTQRPGQNIEFSIPYSSAVVAMKLPIEIKKDFSRVLLKLSFIQMCLVNCFNKNTSYTLLQLSGEICTSEAECATALMPLVRASILTHPMPLTSNTCISLGSFERIQSDSLDLIPLKATAIMQCATVKLCEQRNPQANSRALTQKVESRIIHRIKSEGPQSGEDLMTYISTVLHPSTITRSELKRALETLLSREMVVRNETLKKFEYCP